MPFYYEHFKPHNYQHYPQNWAIVQDKRGVIYVANKDGVLEYDGARWQLIETTKKTVVRSLAVDNDGKVYVGTNGDFGYLAPDSVGTLVFVSLLEAVPPEERDFSDVWGTHATSEGLYFQAKKRLFRWDGQTIKTWKSEAGFHTSFVVDDRFYVREFKVGLQQVVEDELDFVPGGAYFADIRIYVMLPFPGNRLLIGTKNKGFFLYDQGAVTPFETGVDPLLKNARLYHGCVLPGGLYALATLGGGGLIMDQQGRLIQRLNKNAGFPDEWINYVYTDVQGGLWMALDASGIARVDIPAQLTVYNDQLGLEGSVHIVERHRDTLYVGTSTGLVKLQPSGPGNKGFLPSIEEVRSADPTGDLLSMDSVLFAATHSGLFRVDNGAPDTLLKETHSFALFKSERYPGHVLVGIREGLSRLHYTPEGWHLHELYTGEAPASDIRSIEESNDGTLWLTAADGTVLRGPFPETDAPWQPERFHMRDGLPVDFIDIGTINGEVVFLAKGGVYRFNPKGQDGNKFYKEISFVDASNTSAAPLRDFAQGPDGTLWMVYENRIDIARLQADGSYQHESPRVLRFPKSTAVKLVVEEDGIAWIGNGDQLVRYDARVEKDYTTGFSTLLRRIVATRTERVLYGGAPVTDAVTLPSVVDPADNDLRFEVSAPSYHDVRANRYQYFMEGIDQTWSEWTYRPYRTYNDLEGGDYTLRVRALDAQGSLSEEATFTFRVLPPWYRTWWAYALYLMALMIMAAFCVHHYRLVQQSKRAQEQARELEREREHNQRLQEVNESLIQANRLKDEFLANTSHELRTPLTAILGFTHILQEELPEHFQELLDPIESNSERLLHTLNSLLEVARLRAGTLELDRHPLNIGNKAAEVLRLLAPLAQQGGLALDLERSPKPLYANLDGHCFEQILNNLVGNAIKFTEKGGVTVTVKEQGGRVAVHVRDTGIGIDESFIPFLFDEFKQESTGLARSHEGNGLGLTITARLVELMDGEIEVQSEKGVGSVFTVFFPLHATPPAVASQDRPTQRLQPRAFPSNPQRLNGAM